MIGVADLPYLPYLPHYVAFSKKMHHEEEKTIYIADF